jgi:hypothetical protein
MHEVFIVYTYDYRYPSIDEIVAVYGDSEKAQKAYPDLEWKQIQKSGRWYAQDGEFKRYTILKMKVIQ